MGKRSRSSSSSSSDSDSSEEKKDKKKSKKEKKKDKKKKDKKKKKEKKKDKKKSKEEVAKVPLVLPRTGSGSVAEERDRLLRNSVPIAVPGNTPEVNDAARFQQAKARLDALRHAQQRPEKSVGYTVRKPNW
mmetsp:Transcript_2808/g.4790  ORF Transcript_2808/g.4790 Transcript_2808/m.4790 type:complete len:132 (+) Transcript_2808:61-456(+)